MRVQKAIGIKTKLFKNSRLLRRRIVAILRWILWGILAHVLLRLIWWRLLIVRVTGGCLWWLILRFPGITLGVLRWWSVWWIRLTRLLHEIGVLVTLWGRGLESLRFWRELSHRRILLMRVAWRLVARLLHIFISNF